MRDGARAPRGGELEAKEAFVGATDLLLIAFSLGVCITLCVMR